MNELVVPIIILFILIIILRLVFKSKPTPKAYKKQESSKYNENRTKFFHIIGIREKFNLRTNSLWDLKNSLLNGDQQLAKQTLDEIAHQTRLEGLKKMQITTKCILNGSETQIFYQISSFLNKINHQFKRNFALYPQTSLRALVDESKNPNDLFWYIAGNRYVDFVVVDCRENYLYPKCVIEYFGSGHYGNTQESKENALRSDEIKRKVLSQINLPLIIIRENDTQWQENLQKTIMQFH